VLEETVEELAVADGTEDPVAADPDEVVATEDVLDDVLDEAAETAFLPYSIIKDPAPQDSALDPLQGMLHLVLSVSLEEVAIVFPQ
jgi:hypothetical protein